MKFISIKEVLGDWLEDTDNEEAYTKSSIYKWAGQAYKFADENFNLMPHMCILQVNNYKAKLPQNFVKLGIAAANPKKEEPCNCTDCECNEKPKTTSFKKTCNNEILEWHQSIYGKDCEIKIQAKCGRCDSMECGCDTKDLIVYADTAWKQANPWFDRTGYSNTGEFGRAKNAMGKPNRKPQKPKFQRMNVTQNEFFRAEYYLGDCASVNCPDCQHSFQIQSCEYINVDFQEGEVLLAYKGEMLDEEGFMMIPNVEALHSAIFYFIESKVFWKKYRTNVINDQRTSQLALQAFNVADAKFKEDISIARSEMLEIPYVELKQFLEDHWFRRIPFYHDDYMGHSAPKVDEEYRNYLNGN